MSKVRSTARAHQSPTAAAVQVEAPLDDGTVALAIRALIPLGLLSVEDALQHEVLTLARAPCIWRTRAASVSISHQWRSTAT